MAVIYLFLFDVFKLMSLGVCMGGNVEKGAVRVTRQFNYGSSGRPEGARVVKLRGFSFRWSEVLYFTPPLLVVLLLIAGASLAVRSFYADEQELRGGAEAEYHSMALDSEDFEAVFLERCIGAQGGFQKLEGLNRLSLGGSVFESGHQYMFEGVKEQSGHYQCTLTDRRSGVRLRFDEGRLLSEGGDVPVDSELFSMVSLMGEFYDPIVDLMLTGRGSILELEKVNWRDQPAFRVRFDRPSRGMQTDVYFSGIDFLALERIDFLAEGEVRTYRYSNYKYVDGCRFPFTVNVGGGGHLLKRIHFSRIDPVSSVISGGIPASNVVVDSNVGGVDLASLNPPNRN